jgi:heme/copper-type cytochrome/quinol oxidase subunit 2
MFQIALLTAGIVLFVKFLNLFKLVPAFNKMKGSISSYFIVLVFDETMRTTFYLGLLVIQIQMYRFNANQKTPFQSNLTLIRYWIMINIVTGVCTNVIVIYYQKKSVNNQATTSNENPFLKDIDIA